MQRQLVQEWLDSWHESGVTLDEGLSDLELANIEDEYGFRFPPDLRALLKEAQPTSHGYTDWRNTHSAGLHGRLAVPVESVLDDVKECGFWLPQWGERPTDTAEALHLAQRQLQSVPTLIPFTYGIYIPDDPPEHGNPLFLVHPSDIVYGAKSLYALAKKSRSGDWRTEVPGPWRHIRFWSDYVDP